MDFVVLVDESRIRSFLLNSDLFRSFLARFKKRRAKDVHSLMIYEIICQIKAVEILVKESNCAAPGCMDGLAELDDPVVLNSGEI